MLAIIELTVEATVNYARVGNYATAFQDPLRFVNKRPFSKFTTEVLFLLILGLCAVYIDSAVVNFAAASGGDFGVSGLSGVRGLFTDIYHATMTFIFSTQLTPGDSVARLVVLLISAQGVGLLILTLAAFSSTVPGNETV
jgi:hypothetical protein